MPSEPYWYERLPQDVGRVAAFLDQDRPHWPNILVEEYGSDLADLMVPDPSRCVLSALYPSWSRGELALDAAGISDTGLAVACFDDDNDAVRAEWLRAVNARLINAS